MNKIAVFISLLLMASLGTFMSFALITKSQINVVTILFSLALNVPLYLVISGYIKELLLNKKTM